MREESRLLQKYATVLPHLNERQRRLVAAADAQMLGYGGIARVARASGLNRSTLHRGFKELTEPALPAERVRQVGGAQAGQGTDPRDPAGVGAVGGPPDARGPAVAPALDG